MTKREFTNFLIKAVQLEVKFIADLIAAAKAKRTSADKVRGMIAQFVDTSADENARHLRNRLAQTDEKMKDLRHLPDEAETGLARVQEALAKESGVRPV